MPASPTRKRRRRTRSSPLSPTTTSSHRSSSANPKKWRRPPRTNSLPLTPFSPNKSLLPSLKILPTQLSRPRNKFWRTLRSKLPTSTWGKSWALANLVRSILPGTFSSIQAQSLRFRLRPEKNIEGKDRQQTGSPIAEIDQDPNVPEPPQHRKDVRLFLGPRVHLPGDVTVHFRTTLWLFEEEKKSP